MIRRIALVGVAFAMLAVLVAVTGVVLRPVLNVYVRTVRAPVAVAQVPTPTDEPMIERSPIPTVTLTYTHTPTETPTPTFTPSATSTVTLTFTPSPTVPTETPTITPRPATAIPQTVGVRCVNVVGDSVASGDVVYEMPGVGYLSAYLLPLSRAFEFQLQGKDLRVISRASRATGISSGNHPTYFNTPEYAALLTDNCAYTVIAPWINDLTSFNNPSSASQLHVQSLATLVNSILSRNPGAIVFVLNYYQGAPQPFANNFASGFTPEAVNIFNAAIAGACNGGSLLINGVRCLDSNTAFAGMGLSHLAGQNTPDEVRQALTVPLAPDAEGMLNVYASTGDLLQGDGVHLSGSGKIALATYVSQFIR